MPTLSDEKRQLRSFISRQKRQLLTPQRLESAACALMAAIEKHVAFATAHTVLLYAAMPHEVPTQALLSRYCAEKRLLLPVVKGGGLELRIYTPDTPMRAGQWGIMEPEGEAFTELGAIDLVLLPGVAFDAANNRLGYGKGYYDKLLAQPAMQHAQRWGLAFDFQVLPHIPTEEHDQQLDGLIVV